MASSFSYRYRPANSMADLRRDAPHAKTLSMAEFLMSDRVQDAALAAADDIAAAAAGLAGAEASRTGAYAEAFEATEGAPMTIEGNPRRTAEVYNDDPAAAPVEFGGYRNQAKRILGRAGDPWQTPKGIA